MFKGLFVPPALCCLCLASAAQAAIPEDPWYVGIHYGAGQLYSGAQYHINGKDNAPLGQNDGEDSIAQNYSQRMSSSSATMINAGFAFSKHWAVETQGAMSGVLDMPFFNGNEKLFDEAELSAQAFGLYGVYQAGSDVYMRARLGVGLTNMSLSGGEIDASYTGYGLTYGLTFGKKLGKLGGFEITYMRYADAVAEDGENCLVIEQGAGLNPTACVPDTGATSYFKVNEKMRFSTLTVGYTFIF
ncbi:MAG: hypothetical protein OXE99_11080 [Cellvibrionales bacterium]|nr:hypothetical protein [Cellvibrionales bacterium]